jgi:hypothetical protein
MRWLAVAMFLAFIVPAHSESVCSYSRCDAAPYAKDRPAAKPRAKVKKPVVKSKPSTKPVTKKPVPEAPKTAEPTPAPVDVEEPVKVTAVPNVPVEPLDLDQIENPYIALFDKAGRFYGQYKVQGKVKRVGTAGPMVFEQVCTDEDRKTIFDGRCKRWRLVEKSEPSSTVPYWSFVTESGRLIVWDQVAIVSLTPLPIKEKGVLQ